MIQAHVKVKFAGMVQAAEVIENGIHGTSENNPIRMAFKQWAVRYRVFVQRRFDLYSRGGGDWAPLKTSTIKGRKKGSSKNAALVAAIRKNQQRVAKIKSAKSSKLRPQDKSAKIKNLGAKIYKARKEMAAAKASGSKPQRKRSGQGGVLILRDTGLLFAALNPTLNTDGGTEEHVPGGIIVGYGGPARHGNGVATIADIASYHDQGAGHLPQRQIIVEPDDDTNAKMAKDMDHALLKVAKDLIETDFTGGLL